MVELPVCRNAAPHRIIRRIRIGGGKREPGGGQAEHICLLELYLPGDTAVQRRAIQVNLGGEAVWREFEVVRCFEASDDAFAYASRHGISDVSL